MTVAAPQVFDTYYLQQQLNALRAQLESLQVVNSTTLTSHIGNVQGADLQQLGVSVQGGGQATPAVTTVSGALPSTTTVTGTNPSVTNTSATAPTVTSTGVSLPATNPTVSSSSLTLPTPALGSQDTLAESVELAAEINGMELLLDGALNDKIDARTGKARKSLTIGFPISFERPSAEDYSRRIDSVAEVRVTLCSPSKDVSIMRVLPQERTYDVAGLVDHSASASVGGVIGGVFSLGGGFLWSHQRYDLVRQQETVALRTLSGTCPDSSSTPGTSFMWQIQPVLGNSDVRTGTQENFVQLSLPSDGTALAPGSVALYACVSASWKKIKKGGKELGDGGLRSEGCYPVFNFDTTPELTSVDTMGIGNGNLWVTAKANAILPGTAVRVGAAVLPTSALSFPDTTTIEFSVAAADLINAGGAFLVSRDGKSVALANHGGTDHTKRLEIKTVTSAAFSNSVDKLTLTYSVPLGNDLPAEPCDPLPVQKPGQPKTDPACLDKDPWIVTIGGKAYGLADAPFLRSSEDFNQSTGTIELLLPSDTLASASKLTLQRLLWSPEFYRAEWPLKTDRVAVSKVTTLMSTPGLHLGLSGANLKSAKLMYPQLAGNIYVAIQDDFATIDISDADAKGVNELVVCQLKPQTTNCDQTLQPLLLDLPKDTTTPDKPSLKAGKTVVVGKGTSVLIDGSGLDQVMSVRYAGSKLNTRVTPATPSSPAQLQVDLPPSIYNQVGNYPLTVEFGDKSVVVYTLGVVKAQQTVGN
ncbi:MAG TPA: hypothetical protein VHX60_17525 [Acidobacteriaceae bacterium]|nr:hypothetical protein [Acidobacteriaceae bacterium]